MNSFYYTEVTWCYWENSTRKMMREAVIICAASYGQAAAILEENYGEELYSIDKIEAISEDHTMPLSITAGRALRNAVNDYGAAEIVEETDFSKKSEPVVENTAKEIRWNPNTSAFPADAPRGTVIICESTPCEDHQTFAQNWEGVVP